MSSGLIDTLKKSVSALTKELKKVYDIYEINNLNKEIQELKKDIENNPWLIVNFLSKIMK